MNSALDILRRERDEAGEQIRMLRLRIRDLESAIGVLEGHPTPSRQPRAAGDLKQIVLKRLTDADGQGGTPKELADEFTQHGRPTSDASISSTLSRLKAESKVTNRNGRWFATGEDHSEAASAPSKLGPTSWDDSDDDSPF